VVIEVGKHKFTAEESHRGASASVQVRKADVKLGKAKLSMQERLAWLELAKAAIAQPVISGSLAYFAVGAVEGIINTAKNATTTPAPQQSLGSLLSSLLSGWNPISGIAGPGSDLNNIVTGDLGTLLAAADLEALKVAIILYIATGGNLVGLLQSSGGAFSGLMTKILPAVAAAVG
jgi:hypothetical protein